jgi:hypothetical protein
MGSKDRRPDLQGTLELVPSAGQIPQRLQDLAEVVPPRADLRTVGPQHFVRNPQEAFDQRANSGQLVLILQNTS